MTGFGLLVHLIITDVTLESDENGCCLHKNVEEYRGEERFRTRARISVKKGSKASGMKSFREVDPRSFHLMLKVGSPGAQSIELTIVISADKVKSGTVHGISAVRREVPY